MKRDFGRLLLALLREIGRRERLRSGTWRRTAATHSARGVAAILRRALAGEVHAREVLLVPMLFTGFN